MTVDYLHTSSAIARTLNVMSLLLYILVIQSCSEAIEPDLCEDVECRYGGICFSGECDCPEGLSGDNCEIQDFIESFD